MTSILSKILLKCVRWKRCFFHIRWQNWWSCESWTNKTRKLCHGKDTFYHIVSYELYCSQN